jgi:hypothetical protein
MSHKSNKSTCDLNSFINNVQKGETFVRKANYKRVTAIINEIQKKDRRLNGLIFMNGSCDGRWL